MTIYNLAKQEIKHLHKYFEFPTQEGIFRGTLIFAQWSKHSIIHTFWKLDNGAQLDCVLFKDNRPDDITLLPDNVYAELTFVRLNSGNVYLREIREISSS